MRTEPKPYALDAGEGTAHWFFGSLVTVKAASEDTGGRFALTEFVNPPSFASPLHVHHDEHEAFYVLEGSGALRQRVVPRRPRQLRPTAEGHPALARSGRRHAAALPGADDWTVRAVRRRLRTAGSQA